MSDDSSNARPNLIALPLEIVTLILSYIEPIDIITLRKTCKRLEIFTRDRPVWTNALINLCSTHSVFQPTYHPLDQMSQLEIERTVLTPYRFAELYSCNKDATRSVNVVSRKCVHDTLLPGANLAALTNLYLLPGGRFLLTEEILTICEFRVTLWDLGPGKSPSTISPAFIASLEVFEMLGVNPTQDGLGLCLVVRDSRDVLSVYTIYPTSSSCPTFVLLNSLQLGIHAVLGISPNLAVFRGDDDRNTLVIWDYIRRLKVCWSGGLRYHSKAVFLNDDVMLLFDARTISFWVIPELHEYSETATHKLDSYFPAFEFKCPADPIDLRGFDWPSSLSGSLNPFVALIRKHQEDPIRCYTLEYNNANVAALNPTIIELSHKYPKDYSQITTSYNAKYPFRKCDNFGVQVWSSSSFREPGIRKSEVFALVLDHEPSAQTFHMTKLWEEATEQYMKGIPISLCPVSGRLCVGLRESIRVIDFVDP